MDEKVEEKKPSGPKVRQAHILIAIVVVAIIVVAAFFAIGASGQVVAVGDTINVTYVGSFTNGTVFGSNVGGQQLQFTVGANQLIQGVDQGVVGMRVGENKTITVPVNEAYGPVNPELIVVIPSNTFGNKTVQLGGGVSTIVGAQQMQGVITKINATNVTVDFNSPLAGKTVVFQVKVDSIVRS
jgi:FKBP-type peptidyl-prolyl cis-trans isomerase 2